MNSSTLCASEESITIEKKEYPPYLQSLDAKPDIPSPYTVKDGTEVIVSMTGDNKYIIIPVTQEDSERKGMQLLIDSQDFPTLGRTGLHAEAELKETRMITGRSIAEITELGRPGRLSEDGFMSHDEDIISVLQGDNRIVKKLGLTHPQLAKALFHVLNLTEKNLDIKNYHSFHRHHAEYPPFFYNGKKILVNVEYTKGGQKSIFDDGIEGALAIRIRRDLEEKEKEFLSMKYSHLSKESMLKMIERLTHILTGEMEPYYVMRYGFYEGHTEWRVDPIVLSFLFGIRNIEEIEGAFPGQLSEILFAHFTTESESKRSVVP